jgi:aryl-alcohol dehydrogenase-like predicted oxidoreductase
MSWPLVRSGNILTIHSLGKSGLKVSRIILGCMSYGSSDWQPWVMNEEESLPILEHAYKNGINTWDTVSL